MSYNNVTRQYMILVPKIIENYYTTIGENTRTFSHHISLCHDLIFGNEIYIIFYQHRFFKETSQEWNKYSINSRSIDTKLQT